VGKTLCVQCPSDWMCLFLPLQTAKTRYHRKDGNAGTSGRAATSAGSLAGHPAGDNGKQFIRRRHWPSSFVILDDSEELFPNLNRQGRTSLPTVRAEAEAHEEAEPTQGPGSIRVHAPCRERSRSSSPYPYPAGGSTNTSSAES
jgi:hypothetical protein